MPGFVIPITRSIRSPDPSGPIRCSLQPLESAEVRTNAGFFVLVPNFIVDTGSAYTMMSAERARQLGFPLLDRASEMPIRTATGTLLSKVYDGELSLRFGQIPGRVFRLYCVFVEGMSPSASPLLGLNDFFDAFRITFDGAYSPDAPAGHMLFEPA